MKRVAGGGAWKVDINSIINDLKECHNHGDSFLLVTFRHKGGDAYEVDITYDHPATKAAAITVLQDDVETPHFDLIN
jgi:hypothetical protein